MPTRRHILLLSASVALMATGTAVGLLTARYYRPQPHGAAIEGLLWPNPKQIGAFEALDESGAPFRADQLRGKWSMLFFGYTHCPDVCPITLAVLHQVRRTLVQDNEPAPQVLFVTVDPERDPPQRLREYVTWFDKAFKGVGGSAAQVQSLSAQFGIAAIPDRADEKGDYTVEHSASVFLTDPGARLVGVISAPTDAARVIARYRQIRAFIESRTAG